MKAKAIMVLGTASGVGKSLIAAGLCRLFSDWGFRVAPFKAQNMSNNSYVTEGQGEIGRAQAVQAECARVKPSVDMNPILLKPAADNHSQVIVQGKSTGHYSAREYYSGREKLQKAVLESYEKLAAEYEIIVIEGAGSPAEVNLKPHDLVNMKMAEMADAYCVLVGDIDRGGVFAQILGTLDLLEPHERDRIAGVIVNKFRGDLSLFQDGIDFLEKRGGKKVWGVLPYDKDLWIDEEDAGSKSFRDDKGHEGTLDIAVIHLPHISNFTDFEILQHTPGVRLRWINHPSEFKQPDLLILPGTKATVADLLYLKESGLASKIHSHAYFGGRVLGICGGYQMMGRTILDPQNLESSRTEVEGLNLLDVTTEFCAEKTLKQARETLKVQLFGYAVEGEVEAYEIHMGQTILRRSYEPFGPGGAIDRNGLFAGTYYHGLFDGAAFRSSFLKALAQTAGKSLPEEQMEIDRSQFKEIQYTRLKKLIETHLDLTPLRECLGIPPLTAPESVPILSS